MEMEERKAWEPREAERKIIEAEMEAREAEDRRDVRRLQKEKKERDKERQVELEKVKRGVSAPKKKKEVESLLVQGLKLIPDFDELKVGEWSACFEMKTREFKWP